MKLLLTTLASLLVTAWAARAQTLSVALVLDQDQYLAGESLVVKVRISNFAGQNVEFGRQENWLTFTLEDSHHLLVPRQDAIPVLGAFTLESSTVGTKKVDIAPHYDLTQPGRYYLKATVNMAQWGQSFETKAVPFDIIKGSSLWEQDFGVPGTVKSTDGSPEIRRYALIQTLHAKSIQLYFRLSDTKGQRIFRAYPLGLMVSFSNPEPQLDRFSNLHILYQTTGRAFVHCLINPEGMLIARETYEFSDSRPMLRAEKDGRITVTGGTRRFAPGDLPPPVSSNAPINGKPNAP
jgi:hypothetical protein